MLLKRARGRKGKKEGMNEREREREKERLIDVAYLRDRNAVESLATTFQ